jgi:hypothetical protein
MNKKKKVGKCGPYPVFMSCTLAFFLQLWKKHGKNKASLPLYYIRQQIVSDSDPSSEMNRIRTFLIMTP